MHLHLRWLSYLLASLYDPLSLLQVFSSSFISLSFLRWNRCEGLIFYLWCQTLRIQFPQVSPDRVYNTGSWSVYLRWECPLPVSDICSAVDDRHLSVTYSAPPTLCVSLWLYVVYVPVYGQHGCLKLWANFVSLFRRTPQLCPTSLVTVTLKMSSLPASPTSGSSWNRD